MDEIEQATAAPGEKRNVRRPTLVRCPHCGEVFAATDFEVDE